MENKIKKQASEPRDFRERFEFRLTVNDIIFCQRYFKINNFNPDSLRSYELVDTIRYIAQMIDRDLKMKTLTYLELYSPRVFNTEEEMFKYFENPYHRMDMTLGEGIMIKDEKAPNYFWNDKDEPQPCENRFEDKEILNPIDNGEVITYKFAFYDNGKEVCSTVWDGYYPKMVRNSIDLTNKKFKNELTYSKRNIYQIGFEDYIKYKMFDGKQDLVYNIIKEICKTCCYERSYYITEDTYKGGKKNKTIKYTNPKLDDESIEKHVTKRFAKFYK